MQHAQHTLQQALADCQRLSNLSGRQKFTHAHGGLRLRAPLPAPSACLCKRKRHCEYKVALRCVRESLLPCKSNKYYIFSVCMCARARGRVHAHACNLAYPACNSYPPYWLHHIFQHIIVNGMIFEKKVIGHNICV